MTDFVEISVIIPCFRCTKTIHRSVDSIVQQTLRPSEVILVDDCSGDDTLAELYKIQHRHAEGWVKVIASEKNSGPGTARNLGWEAATKPYIAFLDADDSWHPQKIEVQYGWMQNNPVAVLSGHAVTKKDSSGYFKKVSGITKDNFLPVKRGHLLMKNFFATSTVMLRRDINLRFIDGMRYCEDYQLWLSICFSMNKCFFLKHLALTFQHKAAYGENGLSAALWEMEKGELEAYKTLRDKRFINLFQYFSVLIFSLIKYLKRVLL